jgi:hypothetical protein
VVTGTVIWLKLVELATVIQLVPSPTLKEFVCTCNRQPVWSAGQDSVRFVPLTLHKRSVGVNPIVPVNSVVSLALLEYRNENYARSMEWCRLCLASHHQAAQAAVAHTVLALCLYHTKHLKEGDAELGIARNILSVRFPTELDQSNSTQGFWFDWLAAHVLFKAAEKTKQDFSEVKP